MSFEDERSADSEWSGVPAYSSSKPTAVTWRANLAYHATENWLLFINAGPYPRTVGLGLRVRFE